MIGGEFRGFELYDGMLFGVCGHAGKRTVHGGLWVMKESTADA